MNKLTKIRCIFDDLLVLKKIRRTGWQLRGIKECESIADHCFGVVFLSNLLCDIIDKKLNKQKVLEMAILHEIGESKIGDIPFTALKYYKNKSEIELSAFQDIFDNLPEDIKNNYIELFKEFEEAVTPEARFVKAIDKLEMLITAFEYEKTGYTSLQDFWDNDSTFNSFAEFKELNEFALFLKKTRNQRIKHL